MKLHNKTGPLNFSLSRVSNDCSKDVWIWGPFWARTCSGLGFALSLNRIPASWSRDSGRSKSRCLGKTISLLHKGLPAQANSLWFMKMLLCNASLLPIILPIDHLLQLMTRMGAKEHQTMKLSWLVIYTVFWTTSNAPCPSPNKWEEHISSWVGFEGQFVESVL